MKKLYIILMLSVVGCFTAAAQNDDTKDADKHFDRLEYVEAIEDYNKLVEKGKASDYVYKQLAEANYNIYNTKEAERFYAMIIDSDIVDSEDVFRYSQMLKANQKFGKSNEMMHKFAQMAPNDDRAVQFLENPNYLPRLLEKEEKFSVEKLPINSPYSDFGAFEKGSQFFFSSARNESRKTYGWTGEPTLDIFVANMENGEMGEPVQIDGDINTTYHEGTLTITADGTKMYFDRTDYEDGDYESADNGVGQIQLFSADLVNGKWKDVRKVSFSTSDYSFGHPALSPDGKTLYFVSDMPGGQGGSDIYKVAINEDGSFGEPENLGSRINTAGKENTPFISTTGTLYFSSTGHLGLGGLDVFYAEADGDGFSKPENIGKPVNSAGDDLSFTINEETQEGYVSSNRETAAAEKPNDEIFKVKQLEPLCELELIASVMDINTNEPLSGATVTLYDEMENQLASRTTGADGTVSFEVDCDQVYVMQTNLTDYESKSVTVDKTEESSVTVNIGLSPIEVIITEEEVILNPILFEFDKSNITAQAAFELDKLVQVMQKYPEMKIQVYGHTDSRGSATYNQQLSDRRAKSTVQYVISKGIDAARISGEGKGESEPKVDCGSNCSNEQHQTNRRSEFKIVQEAESDVQE
ncbi:MAG TPA: OmpA family protein [Salinimicrobium sp.]|nr:OmpA family protein [Salinimicrobium sp.]